MALIEIHDVENNERGGCSFFKTPEFLDYQDRNQFFDPVIGGSFHDRRHTGEEGTEQFDGGNVTAKFIPELWACQR